MAAWDSIGDMYSVTPLAERQAFEQRMVEIEDEEDGRPRRERKGSKEQVAQLRRLQRANRRLKARLYGCLEQLGERGRQLAEMQRRLVELQTAAEVAS